jgi:tRNA threonylcarbamoyladenosine biosynthesis protein TsaE
VTTLTTVTSGEEATQALGRRLAGVLNGGDVVLLVGGLGAGKTTLVKGLAAGLGYAGEVTSPTFTLCHTYHGRLDLVHVDMWRLERVNEILDLALDEELERGAALVLEWGEAAEAVFGSEALEIRFAEGATEDERLLELVPTAAWSDRLGALQAALTEGDSQAGEVAG